MVISSNPLTMPGLFWYIGFEGGFFCCVLIRKHSPFNGSFALAPQCFFLRYTKQRGEKTL